ncbi:nodulation protein NfeD related protein, partial [mine drainage metagenome]
MTGLAVAHGKNVTAALSMISSDATYTSPEALALNLVDGQANNLSAFLQIEGLASSENAPNVVVLNPNLYANFLTFLSDSFVDGILITVGVLAILLDIYHGSVILSVVGLIMIGLGLIGAEIIGAPLIGLLFLIIGAALILFEFKTGHGFMMITGIVVGVIGAFLLTPSYITYSPSASSSSPFSESNLFTAAALIIVAFMVAYYLQYIIRSLGKKKYTGLEGMIGKDVEVKEELVPEGWVSFEGQRWKARLVSGEKALVGEKV